MFFRRFSSPPVSAYAVATAATDRRRVMAHLDA